MDKYQAILAELGRTSKKETEASSYSTWLLFSLSYSITVSAISMASSGLRLEIGSVFTAMERPVRTWTHLLERVLSLKCEGFIS